MSDPLDHVLLRFIRRSPERRVDEIADGIGLPRTNFGRPFAHKAVSPLDRLVAEGLVEERDGRYRLSSDGRRALADRAYDAG